MAMYQNGILVSFKNQTGKIRQSNIPMLVGQILPDDPQYNFGGLIDEVKIFNYALLPESVKAAYAEGILKNKAPLELTGISQYPNPVTDQLNFLFKRPFIGKVILTDISGKILKQFSIENSERKTIDISGFTPGFYFSKFVSKEGSAVIKFIKI